MSASNLAALITDIHTSRFTSGAAATLALYDWFLVFGQESETVYRSQWTLAKCLFCFVRLITPIGVVLGTIQLIDFRPALPKERCSPSSIFVTFAMLTSIFAAYGLFTLRLLGLYKNQKYMVWFITAFYFATYAATCGVTIASTIVISRFPIYYSDLVHVCTTLGTTHLVAPVWYAPLAYEVFIFSLTAYHAWRDAKVISGDSTPFLVVFYRDGFIAFFIMTGMRIWNIWVYTSGPLSSLYVGTMLMWAISTVLTTRVYMNLVWLVHRPPQATDIGTTADIVFARGTGVTSGVAESIAMHETPPL
ncbi:hypothetical protein M408DRAFT_331232 [Serendipita vermifera MAFF 305830]|uniref:DUF6533 domain-containing protein n=1 Tax=Serendipita vermifera MAFF 305830 TaxID=933852 RepID=A0A0C3B168_SERVB|nr:hypothetical protein M408DRAFT_331232 [Serendipita vermifera MAFF 305830]